MLPVKKKKKQAYPLGLLSLCQLYTEKGTEKKQSRIYNQCVLVVQVLHWAQTTSTEMSREHEECGNLQSLTTGIEDKSKHRRTSLDLSYEEIHWASEFCESQTKRQSLVQAQSQSSASTSDHQLSSRCYSPIEVNQGKLLKTEGVQKTTTWLPYNIVRSPLLHKMKLVKDECISQRVHAALFLSSRHSSKKA